MKHIDGPGSHYCSFRHGNFKLGDECGESRVIGRKLFSPSADYFLFSILAQESFNATVRLKTGFPGAESGSAQKYPRRSNW